MLNKLFVAMVSDISPQRRAILRGHLGRLTAALLLIAASVCGSDAWGQQHPRGLLVQASDGYFYGTTRLGGVYGNGTIFKMDTSGNVSVIHSFGVDNNNNPIEGANPYAGLIQARDGYLYGTTANLGGHYNGTTWVVGAGTIFRIKTDGTSFSVLYQFTGGADGGHPYAPLIQDQSTSNWFYGTTSVGGANANGTGTVYRLNTSTGAMMLLHSFTAVNSNNGTNSDGANPRAGLVQTSDGTLYGTAYRGGMDQPDQGAGTLFKYNSSTGFTVLHQFQGPSGSDGEYPYGGLVLANNGILYGTTVDPRGTIYSYSPSLSKYTCLYTIPIANSPFNGLYPTCTLFQDRNTGTLWGTTRNGGYLAGMGVTEYGSVFSFTLSGTYTNVYSLHVHQPSGQSDGEYPWSGVIQGSDGYFYGTNDGAQDDGTGLDNGTIFRISTAGSYVVLHYF